MKRLESKAMAQGAVILCLIASTFLAMVPTASAQADSNALFARIDAYVKEEMSRTPDAGLALGIVHQDQLVHVFSSGSADPSGRPISVQTPFDIGSIGKTFTALAIHQLAANGQIHLDDPVQTYLPWFRVADPDASKRITVRQVIDQTSGIPREAGNRAHLLDSRYTLEDFVRRASTEALNRPVGQSFEYSNLNYLIAGKIVEAVSRMPYSQYIQEHIFKPLDMDHCYLSQSAAEQNGMAVGYRNWFGFLLPSNDLIAPGTYPMGHAICSAEDMSHYLIAYLNGGMYRGINVVDPGSPLPAPLATNPGAYYDIHWYLQPGPSTNIAEGWSGGSFSYNSDLLILPGKHWGMIILSNSRPDIIIPTTNAASIATGVSYILQGWEPPTDRGLAYWQYYTLIDLGLVGLTGLVVFQLVRLYFAIRWKKPEGYSKGGNLVWIGVDFLLGGTILFGVPTLLGLSWVDLLADFRDISPVLLTDSVLLLAIGAMQVPRMVSQVHTQGIQPLAKPDHTIQP